MPLLRQSPSTLPFPPRVIYTSSVTAYFKHLKPNPLDDYQLLTYASPYEHLGYPSSKYMGDLVMVQLDREYANAPREARCLVAEPGCVTTNFFANGLGSWQWLRIILWAGYAGCFYLVSDCPPGQNL